MGLLPQEPTFRVPRDRDLREKLDKLPPLPKKLITNTFTKEPTHSLTKGRADELAFLDELEAQRLVYH